MLFIGMKLSPRSLCLSASYINMEAETGLEERPSFPRLSSFSMIPLFCNSRIKLVLWSSSVFLWGCFGVRKARNDDSLDILCSGRHQH